MTFVFPQRGLIAVCLLFSGLADSVHGQNSQPKLQETTINSSLNGTPQGVRFYRPQASEPRPLLVLLHTWSGDYRQDRSDWLQEAVDREWFYIQPDFRGPNNRPEACGSELARQDVIDALDWALKEFDVDHTRVYLAGVSGGGHMTMLMSGYAPNRFSAASAWVGISDLKAWYEFHAPDGKPAKYAQMISNSCGGAPGTSADVDTQYVSRSPLTVLARATELPLDLNAGINDGHSGSVPISHTLLAYNAVVVARGETPIASTTIDELTKRRRVPANESSEVVDETYEREIHFRRQSGPTRVTIFEGGHEARPHAACEWLAKQQRKVVTP
ncbi:MAG: prolyl oligopeptidase family serine peptidase [Planctomycetaceae bacterium]|nr:prolyl oligopeptidase family serine peptidase [Planctomycetaceae bacterium]MCB9952774.1 prolyl oligopeptidase family serine peptidase [Planctomycetaceae bacterium]